MVRSSTPMKDIETPECLKVGPERLCGAPCLCLGVHLLFKWDRDSRAVNGHIGLGSHILLSAPEPAQTPTEELRGDRRPAPPTCAPVAPGFRLGVHCSLSVSRRELWPPGGSAGWAEGGVTGNSRAACLLTGGTPWLQKTRGGNGILPFRETRNQL